MEKNFDAVKFISQLLKFSPRQGENEKRAADFIVSVLKKSGIGFRVQKFPAKIPLIKKAALKADNKKIKCEGCCFIGGKIEEKGNLISSLIPSRFFLTEPNINFNPKCRSVSLDNFYFAPALAVSKNDLPKILKAKKVKGEVKVIPYRFLSSNILIGNVKSPENIVFAHYDSIKKGAVDNASGVAVLMKVIISYPETFKNLYVFSGNEELSYENPVYWGHGYRAFEKKYENLLHNAKKIIVVDCVGKGKSVIGRDYNLTELAFPIKNIKKLSKKIFILRGGIDELMSVYHSDLDGLEQIDEKQLDSAVKLLKKELKI